MSETTPNIMAAKRSDVVTYANNMRNFYDFDPYQIKTTNFYFTETVLRIRQNWLDLFEFSEEEISILEQENTQ